MMIPPVRVAYRLADQSACGIFHNHDDLSGPMGASRRWRGPTYEGAAWQVSQARKRKPRTREVMRGFLDGRLGGGRGLAAKADVWSAHEGKIAAQVGQLK